MIVAADTTGSLPLSDRSIAKLFSGIAVSDCWVWTKALSGDGYGRVYRLGRVYRVHRIVWELLVGPIPPDAVLDHRCTNRRCCNPDHLEPVSALDNTDRGYLLRLTHCRKAGHPLTPENTRIHSTGRRSCRTCDRNRRAA